jgi:hypothetical protein
VFEAYNPNGFGPFGAKGNLFDETGYYFRGTGKGVLANFEAS